MANLPLKIYFIIKERIFLSTKLEKNALFYAFKIRLVYGLGYRSQNYENVHKFHFSP